MCRWIAFIGSPIYMDNLVTRPSHSLVEQSINSKMHYKPDGSIWAMNGDGFGVGWYTDDREEPAIFKGAEPAWSNENLHEICSHVKSHIFMAHIRATTTGAVQRSNSHPFKYKNWIFQHNGHLNRFPSIRRDMQMAIKPGLFKHIQGTTDSETFFLLAVSYGLEKDPKKAIEKTIRKVKKAYKDNKIKTSFNLSCAMSDGKKLYTIRYAEGERLNTQYFSKNTKSMKNQSSEFAIIPKNSIVVVSEPLEHTNSDWVEMPENSFSTVSNGKIKFEGLKV